MSDESKCINLNQRPRFINNLIIYFLFLGESFILFLASFLNLVMSMLVIKNLFVCPGVCWQTAECVFFCLFLFIHLCIPT
jgi:hypothetical protein